MKLSEAERKFALSRQMLEEYVAQGLIRRKIEEEMEGEVEYLEEDFEFLGLIEILLLAGLRIEEVKQYLALQKIPGTEEEQIRILRTQRRILLNDIREKQQLLDKLDFLIWNKSRMENLEKK